MRPCTAGFHCLRCCPAQLPCTLQLLSISRAVEGCLLLLCLPQPKPHTLLLAPAAAADGGVSSPTTHTDPPSKKKNILPAPSPAHLPALRDLPADGCVLCKADEVKVVGLRQVALQDRQSLNRTCERLLAGLEGGNELAQQAVLLLYSTMATALSGRQQKSLGLGSFPLEEGRLPSSMLPSVPA